MGFHNQRVLASASARGGGSPTLLIQPFGTSWKDPRTDVGSGETTLPYGDLQKSLLGPTDWVTFQVDDGAGVLNAATIVAETITDGQIGEGEEAQLGYQVQGRTHICEWERFVLGPEEGPMVKPIGTTRYFNFSSKYLDESSWTPSVIPYSPPGMLSPPWGPPRNWPDPFSSFTWSRAWGGGTYVGPFSTVSSFTTPIGTSYTRKHIHVDTPVDLVVYASADDYFEVWIDNRLMLTGDPPPAGNYEETYQRVTSIPAGDHIISVKVVNLDPGFTAGNIAGLALSVFGLSSLSSHIGATNSLTHTGLVGTPGHLVNDGFLWSDLPAAPPGFTPGRMVRVWHDEAVARGCAAWDLSGFSDTLDSAGIPWAISPEYAFTIGTDGLTMLRQIGETDVDWYAVPGQRKLLMWNKGGRGTTKSAALLNGTNLMTATYTTQV